MDQNMANYETRRLEDKLDKMLGTNYWRTYWATSLWANLSTPINLTITIFTSLMATHSTSSSSFLSDDTNMKINLATFFISIINTFFTPQKQFTDLNEYLMKWSEYGNTFETIIFGGDCLSDKINRYKTLLDNINKLHKEQYSKQRNFVTDFIHVIIRELFMGSNDRWMKEGGFEFYDKIASASIELDFNLENLKDEHKKTTWYERFCSCFMCCCKKKKSEEINPQKKIFTQRVSNQNVKHLYMTSTKPSVDEDLKEEINPLHTPSIEMV